MPQTVLFYTAADLNWAHFKSAAEYRNNALSFSLAATVSLSVHVFDFKLLMNPSHRYTA